MDIINPTARTSYTCQWPIDPHIITRYLVNFCQWKFSRLENIQNPYLRREHKLWKPQDFQNRLVKSNILITTVYDYDPEDAQQRPAILIRRNATSTGRRLSLGDKYQTPGNLLGNGHDPNKLATLGQNQQLVAVQGSHSIFIVDTSGGAAEALGIEMWQTFSDYRTPIRKDLLLDTFGVEALRAVGKIREFKDTWGVPIVVTYSYQRNTLLRTESPILKAIGAEYNING